MIWWAAAGLLSIAGLFLLPLLRRDITQTVELESQAPDRRAQNVALYRQYRDELAADSQLTQDQRQDLLAERGRALLTDLAAGTPGEPATAAGVVVGDTEASDRRRVFGPLLLGLLVLVVGSVTLYLQLGQPQASALLATADILELPAVRPTADGGLSGDGARLRALTAQVRAQANAHPDDAGSLYLLGIGELKLGAYEPAAAAFAQAAELVGEDPNLDLFWLQARFFADAGRLTPASQAIADRVLARAPNQPLVLELLSIAALQDQRFDLAVGLLNRALSGPLTLERRQALSRGFETARQSLGVQGQAIDVAIELAQIPPQDAVLFVIARPVGGGIPFAVVRRPAIAIPERVRLDDAVSMNPANPLSAGGAVEVVARLSLSGEVRAAAGDWEWRSPPLQLTDASKQPFNLLAKLSPPRGPGEG